MTDIPYDIDELAEMVKQGYIPVIVRSYDHCQSGEELEFDIYANLLQEGRPDEEAREMAKSIAKDLWGGDEPKSGGYRVSRKR